MKSKKKKGCCDLNQEFKSKEIPDKYPNHELTIDPETGEEYYIGNDFHGWMAEKHDKMHKEDLKRIENGEATPEEVKRKDSILPPRFEDVKFRVPTLEELQGKVVKNTTKN